MKLFILLITLLGHSLFISTDSFCLPKFISGFVQSDFHVLKAISQAQSNLKKDLFNSIQKTRKSLFLDKDRYRDKNAEAIFKIQILAKELNNFFPYNATTNYYAGNQSLQSLLDGKWEVLYSTNSGYSVGRIGPIVGGKVTQVIETSSTKYNNTVHFLNGLIKFTINSKFQVIPISDYMRIIHRFGTEGDQADDKIGAIKVQNFLAWKITFLDYVLELGKYPLFRGNLAPNKLIGIWRLLYIDEEIRIFYSRNYQKQEYSNNDNLYVLKRVPEQISITQS